MKHFAIRNAAIALALTSCLAAVGEQQETFRGTCMGTTYAVTVVNRPPQLPLEKLATQVSDELERIEQTFSLYRPSSELSRLNQAVSDDWLDVTPDLLSVTKRALQLAEETDGAFDPTIAPLVRLWRLKQVASEWSPPSAAAIAKTKQLVGWRLIELRDEPPSLRKLQAGVELDLNALVEGFAIDRVITLMQDHGIQNCLIELGGEFHGCGHKANGQPWRIGIQDPCSEGQLHSTLNLENAALSTSGNYRSAIEYQGRRYGHIIDARHGEPVQHDLAAVSVCAHDALTADGWSTALLALGPTEGFALAEKKGLSACLVLRSGHKESTTGAHASRLRLTTTAVGRFVPQITAR